MPPSSTRVPAAKIPPSELLRRPASTLGPRGRERKKELQALEESAAETGESHSELRAAPPDAHMIPLPDYEDVSDPGSAQEAATGAASSSVTAHGSPELPTGYELKKPRRSLDLTSSTEPARSRESSL